MMKSLNLFAPLCAIALMLSACSSTATTTATGQIGGDSVGEANGNSATYCGAIGDVYAIEAAVRPGSATDAEREPWLVAMEHASTLANNDQRDNLINHVQLYRNPEGVDDLLTVLDGVADIIKHADQECAILPEGVTIDDDGTIVITADPILVDE